MKKVAVLIATNYTRFLDKCLESVKGQADIYILFHNIAIPAELTGTALNIYPFNLAEGTISVARNALLDRAVYGNYEYVQFLDSDDEIKPDYLNSVLKEADENPEFGLYYTDYSVYNDTFNFTYDVYCSNYKLSMIKNPLIRLSVLGKNKFDPKATKEEYNAIYSAIGIKNIYHIPKNLQLVREHAKMHSITKKA